MTLIYTTSDLIEYAKRLERQREILKISPAFSPLEKIEIDSIMKQLHKITINRLAILQDIEDAINL